jgi:predicted MFS family arabinose efflux permease
VSTTHTPPADGSVVIRSASDVHGLVNSGAAIGSHAKTIVLIALGGIFLDAYDLTSLAYGTPDITHQFGLTPAQTGFLTASITIGSVFGALFGGHLVDKIGRYRVFMADMLFFVVSAIGGAVAPNAVVLTLFRFVMGFGIGMDLPVAMAFLAEFSRLRGKGSKGARTAAWSPAWYAATSACYVVILALYFALPEQHHAWLWRFTVGFGAIPALVILLVRRRYMNESPSWAADQGDLERAAEILRSSYGVHVVVASDADRAMTRRRSTTGLKEFGRLFTRHYRSRTILALCIGVGQTFGYNAVIYGLPIIISTFLRQGPLTTIISSLVLNIGFAVTGGLLGVRLANGPGAWPMTLLGFATQFTALIALAVIGHPSATALVVAALAALGAYLFAQASGPGAHCMTFATLSYPTSLRGVGIGFNQGIVRTASALSLFLFPMLSADLGTGVFWVIAIAPAVGLTALALIRWEPIGYDAEADEVDTARPAQAG